jgi:large subunit ribosomal protein L21e
MSTKIGSSRRKTKHLLTIPKKMKGKLAVSGFMKKFDIGKMVKLSIKPSIVKGMYFRRFHGRVGKVIGIQGKAYKVHIKDGNKDKTLIIGPIHLENVNLKPNVKDK